jgi:hypothetical protein
MLAMDGSNPPVNLWLHCTDTLFGTLQDHGVEGDASDAGDPGACSEFREGLKAGNICNLASTY